MISAPVLIVCAVLLLIVVVTEKRKKRGPKRPPSINLIHIANFIWNLFGKGGSIAHVIRYMGSINSIVRCKFGIIDVLLINDFTLGRDAFKKLAFSGKSTHETWCYPTRGTHGIMNSNKKKWEEQRRFCQKHLRNFGFGTSSMESLIQTEINDFVENISQEKGALISPNKKFYLPVLNSIWMILAGERSSNEDGTLFQMTIRIYHAFMEAIKFPELLVLATPIKIKTIEWAIKWFPFVKWIFPGLGKFHVATEELRNYCHELIYNRQKALRTADVAAGSPKDLLDVYLNEIERTSDETSEFFQEKGVANLLGVMIDFFLAGGDTTATMLQWNLLHLIRNPEMQRRIQREIDSVAGRERGPTLDDRPSCPFTEAFMEEALRFTPVSMFSLPHEALEDTHLGGYFIPKGSQIYLNIENIHRDPLIWGDPNTFRPERFLSPDGSTFIKHEAMLAFSTGRRRCLGEQLARDNMFLFVSSICQRFTLEGDPQLKGPPGLIAEVSGVNTPKKFHMIAQDRRVGSSNSSESVVEYLDCNENNNNNNNSRNRKENSDNNINCISNFSFNLDLNLNVQDHSRIQG